MMNALKVFSNGRRAIPLAAMAGMGMPPSPSPGAGGAMLPLRRRGIGRRP